MATCAERIWVGFGVGARGEVGEGDGRGVGVCVGEGEGVGVCVGEGVDLPEFGKPGTGTGGRGRVCCPFILIAVAREISRARPRMIAMIMVTVIVA